MRTKHLLAGRRLSRPFPRSIAPRERRGELSTHDGDGVISGRRAFPPPRRAGSLRARRRAVLAPRGLDDEEQVEEEEDGRGEAERGQSLAQIAAQLRVVVGVEGEDGHRGQQAAAGQAQKTLLRKRRKMKSLSFRLTNRFPTREPSPLLFSGGASFKDAKNAPCPAPPCPCLLVREREALNRPAQAIVVPFWSRARGDTSIFFPA